MKRIELYVFRHGKPEKDPETGASLDSLSSEGKNQAQFAGNLLRFHTPQFSKFKGFHSPKSRAKETLDLVNYGSRFDFDCEEEPALNTLNMTPEVKSAALAQAKTHGYDGVVQYLLDNAVDESFAHAGSRVVSHLEKVMNDFIRDDHPGSISVTHGPVIDATIVTLLDQSGLPVSDIKELGGAVKPAEGFKLSIDYRKDGSYITTLHFRNTETVIGF